MTLSLYMDHHVPFAVTMGLRRRGVDVITTAEDQSETLEDEVLLARVTSLSRVMFTQDEDLLGIARAWLVAGREFAGLAYAHQLGISIGQAVRDLELLAKVPDPADMLNRVEFLPFP